MRALRLRILPATVTILILLSLSSLGLAQDGAQIPLGTAGGSAAALSELVTKANAYLSAGKFSDAVKTYSEAIGACVIHSAASKSLTDILLP